MGGVAEGAEIGVMRGHDKDFPAGTHQAVKLFHAADNIRNVLDDVDCLKGVEGAVAERVGEAVKVAQDVGATGRISIDADGACLLVDPAADVEDSHGEFS